VTALRERPGALALHDPLGGLPRPLGDAGALAARAFGLGRAAGTVAGVRERLGGSGVLLSASWRGTAADGARGALESARARQQHARDGLHAAGCALGRHAALLARMQQQWDAARRLADADTARQAAAGRAAELRASTARVDDARAAHHAVSLGLPPPSPTVVVPYVPDPVSPDRLRAARLAAEAVDLAARSALLTARVLTAVDGELGPRGAVRPDVVRSPGDTLRVARDEAGQVLAGWRDAGRGALRLVTPGQAGNAWARTGREVLAGAGRLRDDPVAFAGEQVGDALAADEWEAGNTTRAVVGTAAGLPGAVPGRVARLVTPSAPGTPGAPGRPGGRSAEDRSGPDGVAPAPAVPAGTRARAEQIAGGHAWDKHVRDRGEFPDIPSRAAFAALVAGIIDNPSDSVARPDGWRAYWDDATGTVVVVNPLDPDGGSCFRPARGEKYFEDLKRYSSP